MKRVAELRDLSDDHHTSLVLARRCIQATGADSGASPTSWEQVQEAFSQHLAPHFEIEERHLCPALEAIGESQLADRIRKEHSVLRALCEADGLDAPPFGEFGRLLHAHVRFEEREVFEPTQHRLPARSLRAIADACGETPRTCPATLLE